VSPAGADRTINDAPEGLDDNSGELTVSIWESW